MRRDPAALAVGAAVVYLAAIGVAMGNLPFDVWGALVTIPLLGAAGVAVARRMFHDQLRPLLLPVIVGLVAKAGGSMARYWVAFDAYGGSTDAQRYHTYAKTTAAAFWNGDASLSSVLPGGTGTQFVERTTAFLYAFTGSSRLAGFMTFGWLAWFGAVLFLKAAIIAVPKVRRLRYAWLLMLWPSLVYWPASIGKEATICLLLGTGSYGLARLLQRQGFWWPLTISAVGLTGAGLIRAHLAFIWLVGLVPALLVSLGRVARAIGRARHATGRAFATALVIVLAVGAAWSVGNTAVNAIRPTDEQQSFSKSITEVLRETTSRSEQGGSSFTPPSTDSPLQWPYAAVRTITRPLPTEAKGLFQLLTSADTAALLLLFALNWRRVAGTFHWQVRIPFVALATSVVFAGAVAYANFANLGILARQRSLLLPFLLLLPCLPEWQPRRRQPIVAAAPLVPSAAVRSPIPGT